MAYDIQLENVSARPLAVVRRRARLQELSKVVPAACGFAWSALKARQIKGGKLVAIYLDDQINLEVGVEIDAPLDDAGKNLNDDLFPSATPAGKVATTVHFGPYQRLADAHNAIRQWCAVQGHAFAGPNWEIYDHWKDEWINNPSQIRTDVYYLLKADGSAGY